MNEILGTIKKLVANKNTVTILATMAAIVIIWYFYNMNLQNGVQEVTVVYAKQKIASSTPITSDMIGTIKLKKDVAGDAIRNMGLVIGKYVNENSTVPEGGLFYQQVVDEKTNKILVSGNVVDKITDNFSSLVGNQTVFKITKNINLERTYGNSIMPGTYVDIYVTYKSNGDVYYGEVVTCIPVLSITDGKNNSVFNQTPYLKPSVVNFAVSNEDQRLLKSATDILNYEFTLVPRGKKYGADGSCKDYKINDEFATMVKALVSSTTNY